MSPGNNVDGWEHSRNKASRLIDLSLDVISHRQDLVIAVMGSFDAESTTHPVEESREVSRSGIS